MALAFFGLRPTDRVALHNQLFELVYYGHFLYSDLYNMPVYIKSFLYKKLIDTRKNEREQVSGKVNMADSEVKKKSPKKR